MTNTVFDGVLQMSLWGSCDLYAFNNLFLFGTLDLMRYAPATWLFRDNLFHSSLITDEGDPLSYDHNGYVQCNYGGIGGTGAQMLPAESTDHVLSSLAYEKGPFGKYYLQGAPAGLINQGSRDAAEAGLFHYTTSKTPGSKEGNDPNPKVDIGPHYVAATDANLPTDTDQDGLLDVEEDVNGNGVADDTETNLAESDTDGDGLDDVFEIRISHTGAVNPDTGNTGVSDGYKDSDNDGWTNIDEARNGTDPNVWNAPPGPRLTLLDYVLYSHSTLEWEPASGAPTQYVIERIYHGPNLQIGQVNGSTTGFVDSNLPDTLDPFTPFTDDHSLQDVTYRVKAVYGNGDSQWSNEVRPYEPANAVESHIVSGPGGHPYLVTSHVPEQIQTLRVHRVVAPFHPAYPYSCTFGLGNVVDCSDVSELFQPAVSDGYFDIPAESMSDGVLPISDSEAPPYGNYHFGVEALGPVNYPPVFGPPTYWAENVPFLDGSAQLKQNLRFLLSAADAIDPFSYRNSWATFGPVPNTHAAATFWPEHPSYRNPFEPFEQNQYWRNFLFDQNEFDANGNFLTGLMTDWQMSGYPDAVVDPNYGFDTFAFVSANGNHNIPSALPQSPSIYFRPLNFEGTAPSPVPEIGVTITPYAPAGTFNRCTISLDANARNLYGLRYTSVDIAHKYSSQPLAFYHVPAGSQVTDVPYAAPFLSANRMTFFATTEEPQLETVGYYFVNDKVLDSTDPLYQPELFPGHISFDNNTASRLLITSVGESIRIAGYAKQWIANGYPNKFAYLGQYFDKAYKADEYGNATTTETGVLSEYGDFFPTEPGLTYLTTKPEVPSGGFTPATAPQPGAAPVHVISLNVDANHDGVMDRTFAGPDMTSAVRPFRFWINDDNDSGDTIGNDVSIVTAYQNIGPANWQGDPSYFGVNGVRDLVDFFPVYLNIGSLVAALPPIASVKYRLSQADSAVNFAYTELARDDFRSYLTDINVAQSFASAQTFWVTSAGVDLSTDFLQSIQNQNHGVIIVEGRKPTKQPLVLEVVSNGHIVGRAELHLSIDRVETMFRHKNLIWEVTPAQRDGPPDRLTDNSVPNEPETNGRNFVFLHGYNVNPLAAQGSFAELFKRMYWSGSHAKFYGVTWRGYQSQGQILPGITCNYHTNVYNAFLTAPRVSAFLQTLTSGPTVVMAHSLGNMAVLSALSDWNAPMNSYFMLDAAVAIEAIQGDAQTVATMTYSDWAPYARRLFSHDWYQLFPGDARGTLAWNDRLSIFHNTAVYNFYSSGEEVLREYPDDPPSGLLSSVIPTVKAAIKGATGSFAWAWQEKAKGRASFDNCLGSTHGGWKFNGYYDGPTAGQHASPSVAATLSDAQLRTDPFFGVLNFNNLHSDGLLLGVNGSAYAQANRNRILSDAIPALTLPIGANPVARLAPQFGENRNFNMNGGQFNNGWPASRSTGPEAGKWHHSDFREVAYTFIHPLFDEFVNRGNLK